MSEGLFGLVGAAGGALIAGLVAYFGPIRLHARQALLAVQQQADAQRHAEQQEERAREEAQRVERLHRGDAELQRLVALRSAPRNWDRLLRRWRDARFHGRSIDLDRFDAEVAAARDELSAAIDAVAVDGVWIPQTEGSPRARDFRAIASAHRRTPERFRWAPDRLHDAWPSESIVIQLERATEAVREVLASPVPPGSPGAPTGAPLAFESVDRARRELTEMVVARVATVLEVRRMA